MTERILLFPANVSGSLIILEPHLAFFPSNPLWVTSLRSFSGNVCFFRESIGYWLFSVVSFTNEIPFYQTSTYYYISQIMMNLQLTQCSISRRIPKCFLKLTTAKEKHSTGHWQMVKLRSYFVSAQLRTSEEFHTQLSLTGYRGRDVSWLDLYGSKREKKQSASCLRLHLGTRESLCDLGTIGGSVG